ncbi:MAG: hypothetical protein V9H26_02025 [Verrucomicrobiota bacterium]
MKKLLLNLIVAIALVVSSRAGIVFSDTFNYPDGGIVTNSAGIWVANTGTANTMLASNSELVVSTSRTEDIAASLGATYMTNGATPALYASFSLNYILGDPLQQGRILPILADRMLMGP